MTESPQPRGGNSSGVEVAISRQSSSPPPPIVYGELSILGYNGYIPNIERNGRRNRSKFLLCKRAQPNGIKKSRHYIVKQQPQSTKAIQDKELHSISYTFSRSQTIIVEYRQDENTDMFQIGRSSEEPIDFVVMDTMATNINALDFNQHAKAPSANHHNHHHHHHHHQHHHNNHHHQQQQQQHNENNAREQHNIISGDILSGIGRLHRHLTKVGEDYIYRNPISNEVLARNLEISRQQAQAYLLNNPQANISNLPPIITEQIIRQHQESAIYQRQHQHILNNPLYHGQSSSSHQQQQQQLAPQQQSQQQQQQLRETSVRSNNNSNNIFDLLNNQHISSSSSSRHNNTTVNNVGAGPAGGSNSKKSHATQSTISRFACRILVDRNPPYTARIYAAGFDSSKNIFLGEKATKWEQNNTIDGLTTNGVLLMHPKRYGYFQNQTKKNETNSCDIITNSGDTSELDDKEAKEGGSRKEFCSKKNDESKVEEENKNISSEQFKQEGLNLKTNSKDSDDPYGIEDFEMVTNEELDTQDVNEQLESGGIWREVSVDGGIYAIRESRSAAQKGTRITNESNILQDGTLIDLCGATLLWRSVEGFKASPSKKSLEDKIDMLNATRPQCPVGLNTLVIPRKPIIPSMHGHHEHHHRRSHTKGDVGIKDHDKTSHQPYVYLKCGHVQGYHDWGATDKLNERTCPICLAVGTVAKLSMGLEPSFYVDSGPLSRVFNPCGHMASELTIKYWSSIKIPHGTHFFHSICPFCATPLATNEPTSTKLIFQDDLD